MRCLIPLESLIARTTHYATYFSCLIIRKDGILLGDAKYLLQEKLMGKDVSFNVFRLSAFQQPVQFNTNLRGGQLFAQYVVIRYCKTESERLRNFQNIQQRLRAFDYSS